MDNLFFLSRPFDQATLQLVDDVLLAVAGRIWEETRDIAPPGAPVTRASWQAEERRNSPLGLHVLQVADYANGGYRLFAKIYSNILKMRNLGMKKPLN